MMDTMVLRKGFRFLKFTFRRVWRCFRNARGYWWRLLVLRSESVRGVGAE